MVASPESFATLLLTYKKPIKTRPLDFVSEFHKENEEECHKEIEEELKKDNDENPPDLPPRNEADDSDYD